MEAVGARLGRSSTRYGGPATVFTGKVRKWKKKWVPLSNPNPNNNSSSNNNHHSSNSNNNGNNNSNPSHLLIYKWTPLSRDSAASATDAAAAPPEEPPRKRFRYVPVAVIEEQKQDEAAAVVDVKSDDEGKLEAEAAEAAQRMETNSPVEKVDVNDVKEEEDMASDENGDPVNEVNESNLDLNLGLKARDGGSISDCKTGDYEASD